MARFMRKKPEFRVTKNVDYKDLDLLRGYVMENGRIVPSRITGVPTGFQRKVTRAVKIARYLALLPYSDSH
ncbi:MAG: 30S ribosomal protein S18 [Gammaproteobacteria bacterium]|nr:30S ribosomal protein S18 [Gammaproteobacteria bacterium]